MDNFFPRCPPIMEDGRHFTDYKSATRKNMFIMYINDITRDDDYRMFLQTNASEIADKEFDFYKKKMDCRETPCIHNIPPVQFPQLSRLNVMILIW